jgi:hypothetical protein
MDEFRTWIDTLSFSENQQSTARRCERFRITSATVLLDMTSLEFRLRAHRCFLGTLVGVVNAAESAAASNGFQRGSCEVM